MDLRLLRLSGRAVLVLAATVLAQSAIADPVDSKTVGGVHVVLGIVPAAMVRSHPKDHAEGAMHGGAPSFASGQYHVMIALFDSKTGDRITDAAVMATVSEPGLSTEAKPLEPMRIADAMSFGNYFKMAGKGPFEVMVRVRPRTSAIPVEVKFQHKH
jgi:hypothetical protein